MPSSEFVLEPNALRTLIQWIADRYTRTAFSDEFNRRIESAQKQLAKSLSVSGATVWRILLEVIPDRDLLKDEEYEVNILCLVRPEVWGDRMSRENAEMARWKIEEAFENVKGLSIRAFDFGSTDDFVISELFSHRTWDVFNYLTHRDRLDVTIDN